jgi:hypothetical protein
MCGRGQTHGTEDEENGTHPEGHALAKQFAKERGHDDPTLFWLYCTEAAPDLLHNRNGAPEGASEPSVLAWNRRSNNTLLIIRAKDEEEEPDRCLARLGPFRFSARGKG